MGKKITKEEFEKEMKNRFRGCDVWVDGRKVVARGRILDKDWWNDKIKKAWEEEQQRRADIRYV